MPSYGISYVHVNPGPLFPEWTGCRCVWWQDYGQPLLLPSYDAAATRALVLFGQAAYHNSQVRVVSERVAFKLTADRVEYYSGRLGLKDGVYYLKNPHRPSYAKLMAMVREPWVTSTEPCNAE